MKFYPYYMLLAVVLCISLFFACTSGIDDFPVDPAHFVEPGGPQGWCIYNGIEGCFRPEADGQCHDGGDLVQICSYSSSSNGESSSSSQGLTNSSSSTGVSSSSGSSSSGLVPPPEIDDGSFEFRNFDYSSSSSKIYFLGTGNMYLSTSNPGQGKFYNTLTITNATEAKCGEITTEVTGLEDLTIVLTLSESAVVNRVGEIIAYAVATCDGKKDTLRTDTATVVADPTFSDCKLPSIYVYKSEPVKNLVTVDNNYGRCTNITYSPATYPATASTTAQSFPTTASCGSHTKACSGLNIAAVASNHLLFNLLGSNVDISNGTTVIEVLDGYDIDGDKAPATKIGCEGNPSSQTWGIKLNGAVAINNPTGWWVSTNLPSYATNGNRILLETTNTQNIKCQILP